jgi:hypothetical protein
MSFLQSRAFKCAVNLAAFYSNSAFQIRPGLQFDPEPARFHKELIPVHGRGPALHQTGYRTPVLASMVPPQSAFNPQLSVFGNANKTDAER